MTAKHPILNHFSIGMVIWNKDKCENDISKSHENALTEKSPRKRIMEKASTPLTEKAKNP